MVLYNHFIEKFSHIVLLRQVKKLLLWDMQTYMPSGATELRGRQLAYIAGLLHRESTNDGYRDALAQMVDIERGIILVTGLTPRQEANLREWAKDFKKLIKQPYSFIEQFYTTATKAIEVWKQAKGRADFALFAPWLQKMVALNRQRADYIGYVDSPYDALMDLYEPGMTSAILFPMFHELASFLSTLVKQVEGRDSPYQSYFDHSFIQEDQFAFAHLLLEKMGVDKKHTRLDLSVHPFCMGIGVSDVRLTTNLRNGLLGHIFAVLHEAGHALYELGLSKEEWATPAGQIASMGLHESQSRWWEVMVGKSFPFWQNFYPMLQVQFPQLKALSLHDFYRHINHVKPSCIRIYADEVTYPLHVVLRYEIEKELIEGSMDEYDVPAVWNAKMEQYLGIVPKDDGVGCLQDIHWSYGHMGYFPTYALGNIYAAQYFDAFVRDFPDWEAKVADGSLLFINEWLWKNIHQFGRMYDSVESIKRVTGNQLSLVAYKNYIMSKYTPLIG